MKKMKEIKSRMVLDFERGNSKWSTQSLKLENETVTNNRAEQPTWWPF